MHTPSQIWSTIQRSLFPGLREELGPLTDSEQRLAAILVAAQCAAGRVVGVPPGFAAPGQ